MWPFATGGDAGERPGNGVNCGSGAALIYSRKIAGADLPSEWIFEEQRK
jgi:hypothetical protein